MNSIPSLGCIGCGNMGSALLAGCAQKTSLTCFGYTRTPARLAPLQELGVTACASAEELVRAAKLILLAVKPAQVPDVLAKIAPLLTREKILLSIAAGVSLASLQEAVGCACPCIRAMPTTTAMVGKGVFAFCFAHDVPKDIATDCLALFSHLGLAISLPEHQFPAFSALIGAGPAYVATLIHGMIQAGIALGFTHNDARTMVNALVEGTAVWAQTSQKHPMELRDMVSSPAGLTIAGVRELERQGLAGITMDAVLAAHERACAMEKA